MRIINILMAEQFSHDAVVLTIVGRRVAGQWHRMRICLGKFSPSDGGCERKESVYDGILSFNVPLLRTFGSRHHQPGSHKV